MGKRSMERATGLTQEQRENLAKSGQRVNLNSKGYSKPTKNPDIFYGARKKQLTSYVPKDIQNMLLDALSQRGKHA
jgi:hypothetical protein